MAAWLVTGRVRRAYRETRAAVGLDARGKAFDDAWFSPSLVMALRIPGLESPRTDLPPQVHFVGAFPSPPSTTPPPLWWDELASRRRPVVHVTQGTFDTDPEELIRPVVAGLADHDATIVVATGSRTDGTVPFPVPANARVAALLPYRDLLPTTDVMVTNGGWGGVLAALAHGIPLVVAGGDLDKPTIAAMVARSGAGIDLRTGRPTPAAVREAVDRVTRDPAFRRHDERLADQLAQHDTAGEVVDLVGQLLATGQPVVRARDPWAG